MAANAARKLQTNKGSTGRYSKMTAAEKQEVDLGKMMGGVDWHASAVGIVIQEGRFVAEEYEPRDKKQPRPNEHAVTDFDREKAY